MAFTLSVGSFMPGTAVTAIPTWTLEPADAFPPGGYIVGEGTADEWGSVAFLTLLRTDEGPRGPQGGSPLRCVDRGFERRPKRRHETPRLCPRCVRD